MHLVLTSEEKGIYVGQKSSVVYREAFVLPLFLTFRFEDKRIRSRISQEQVQGTIIEWIQFSCILHF